MVDTDTHWLELCSVLLEHMDVLKQEKLPKALHHSPLAWSKVRCAWGISSAPKEDQFQIKAAVPFCQLKDSVSRRGKGFCVPLGLNLATGVWENAALQEAKSRLSARGATHLCGKWHRAHSVLFQSPSCQECRGLQVTAQEERLGCEWMHEHGF